MKLQMKINSGTQAPGSGVKTSAAPAIATSSLRHRLGQGQDLEEALASEHDIVRELSLPRATLLDATRHSRIRRRLNTW